MKSGRRWKPSAFETSLNLDMYALTQKVMIENWLCEGYSENKPNMEEEKQSSFTMKGFENSVPVVSALGNRAPTRRCSVMAMPQ